MSVAVLVYFLEVLGQPHFVRVYRAKFHPHLQFS
jgi:hypothetical protein